MDSAQVKHLRSAVEELAAHQARQDAVQRVLKGQPEAYFKRLVAERLLPASLYEGEHGTVGASPLFAPIPFDGQVGAALRACSAAERERELGRLASALPGFEQSPVEMAIRSSGVAELGRLLAATSGPAQRYAAATDPPRMPAWHTLDVELLGSGVRFRRMSEPVARRFDLIILALLLERPAHALAVAKAGWGPQSVAEAWELFAQVGLFVSAPPNSLAAATRIERPNTLFAMRWTQQFAERSFGFDSLVFASPRPKDAESRAMALLADGVAMSAEALARVTEWGRGKLLRAMFEGGADPNGRDVDGEQALASVDGGLLTSEMLQIWLDAGANPYPIERYSGREFIGSPLFIWTGEGHLRLVEQAADRGQGKVVFTHGSASSARESPLLARALANGHEELAFWLMAEKGCRFSHVDEDGKRCDRDASVEVRERLKTRLATFAEAKAMGKVAKDPKTGPRVLGTRTDTL